MYGMIHRAMRHMVLEKLGEDAWLALEQKLDIGPMDLLTGKLYEDALTLEIISEAAARLNLPVDQCLIEFGQYWVRYADQGSLASVMKFTGQNLASFIANLDRLHLAVGAAMPGARLPAFATLQSEPGHLLVEYRSERAGFEPFVMGLLQGLMNRFHTRGQVQVARRGEQCVIFDIRYQDRD
jgi:guanylate cyclase soluble subunit beta